MAISGNISRTKVTTEAVALSAIAIEDTAATEDNFCLDVKQTINSNPRLVARLRVTPIIAGGNISFRIEHLDFSSSADQIYADSKATPFTDAEADRARVIGTTQAINLDAIFTLAGDVEGT